MTPRILLVCDALPRAGRSGHQSYMKQIADYVLDRNISLSVVSVSDRMEAMVFSHAAQGLPPSVDIRGPHIGRLGDFFFYRGARSWIRPAYAAIRSAWRLMAASLPLPRPQSAQGTAHIGSFMTAAESRFVADRIAAEAPDFILVDTIFRAAPVLQSAMNPRAVLIAHDVFHQKFQSLSKVFQTVKPRITEAAERAIVEGFGHVIAVSHADAVALQALAPASNVVVCAPSIRYRGRSHTAVQRKVVFIGSAANHNIDGLSWFIAEVWPLVRAAVPDAALDIAGSICRHIQDGPGINRLHVVAELDGVLSAAACAINPLRAGSGVKVKMMDYLAFGVPVVTSSVGAQGLARSADEPFVVCDEAAAFAGWTTRFLTDPALAARYSAQSEAYARLFSRQESFKALDGIFMPVQDAEHGGEAAAQAGQAATPAGRPIVQAGQAGQARQGRQAGQGGQAGEPGQAAQAGQAAAQAAQ